jgi:hypothetical protein
MIRTTKNNNQKNKDYIDIKIKYQLKKLNSIKDSRPYTLQLKE